MSKIKKARKLRTPNVPLSAGPIAMPEPTAAPRASRSGEAYAPEFDYSDVRKDLSRIGLLAGLFIAVLIGLTFFLR